ncbi:TIGR03619 family F420-dependent LLM class oxidoreductase [Nonomuraea sp. NN258]|uniref:TIGR03619 family F420-dependent LLM class oxidoreductase n=1 Tax=Nonomuraea antri TaxID=2730852 RepID=UPI00156A71BB|nr:TIGR03619 family F420-dependent LLM class oxidoreductase [Nonomuraea antri]NRQ34356.1 TIGR03619 family F420-dependent LLM class oxidoreductase [Nonomuraea antri]
MRFWQAVPFLETEQLVEIARTGDRCGYDAIALSDHLFFTDYSVPYPYSGDGAPIWGPATPWPDPWVTIGALSSVTSRLKLATNVYIAPARDLFTVAKAVSTAAVLSGGRVICGVGAGWCRDEFEQTGQDFATRGRRLGEMVPLLRRLMTGEMVAYEGEFYAFRPLSIAPVPAAPVPVYFGGDSEPALRRAARLGDGWMGNQVYGEEEGRAVLARLHALLDEYGRRDGFEIVMSFAAPPGADLYKRWRDRGVTATMCAPWWLAPPDEARHYASDLAFKVATLERFAEEVIQKM